MKEEKQPQVVFDSSTESITFTKDKNYIDNFFDNSLYKSIDRTFSFFKGAYSTTTSASDHCHQPSDTSESNFIESCNKVDSTSFHSLPEPILLSILFQMDVCSMCRLSRVCKRWYNCLNDPLMWSKKLTRDSLQWTMVDHLSHPALYQLTNPEFTPKEIYVKCCPEYRQILNKEIVSFRKKIPNLRYYFGFATPRIVIFGSGLDSSGFIRGLFWNKTSPFEVKGMFPGQFDGIGSGVTLQYSGGMLNMITLYSLSKAERTNQSFGGDRRSHLLSQQSETNEIILSQRVRELLSTVDALIYIVNSSAEDRVKFGKEEFCAMTDSRWIPVKVPVLVLCINSSCQKNDVPPLQVADHLSMLHLERPWQVQQCYLDCLQGLLPGVKWLHKQVMCI